LLSAAIAWAHPAAGPYQSPGPHQHVGPTNVLVIYNTAWPDTDGNGLGDSLDVAHYYAERRGVPTNNLLGVTISNYLDATWHDFIAYDVFYSNIVVPVVARLDATNPTTAQPFRSNIYYLCPVYGVPPDVNTYFDSSENPFAPWYNARRSLDAYLMNPYLAFNNGLCFTNGHNRPGVWSALPAEYGTQWGDWWYEVGYGPLVDPGDNEWNKYYDDADDPVTALHFKAARDSEWPAFYVNSYGYFLVTRLDGPDAQTACGLVDKALYAERYLRNWAGAPTTAYYGRVYADDDNEMLGGSEPAPLVFEYALGGDIKNWFRGDGVGNAAQSVFEAGRSGALAPWDWIEDCHPNEIGNNDSAIPRVTELYVAALRGFTANVCYASASSNFYFYVASSILRGFEGKQFSSSGGGTPTILAVGTNAHDLAWGDVVLSSTNGVAAGTYLSCAYVPTPAFPFDDALWYSAYYAHSYYPDVFQWVPGAIGFHNESYTCREFRHGSNGVYFAGKALLRGMTALAGPVEEPFNVGIPFARKFYRAVCQGFDFAEACYQSTPCALAWMNVFIGDPLYNPFMALYTDSNRLDRTAPALLVTNDATTIMAALGADSPAAHAEIAQFRLLAGYNSNAWTLTNAYLAWPAPATAAWRNDRRYTYSRTARWSLPTPASNYYYQISARDPSGNETVDAVRILPIPEPVWVWWLLLPLVTGALRPRRQSALYPGTETALTFVCREVRASASGHAVRGKLRN